MEKSYNPLGLLPHYFRYIGYGIIGVLLVIYFTCFDSWADFRSQRDYRMLIELFFILGLLFIITAVDKKSDERLVQLRLKATMYAFYTIFGLPIAARIIYLFLDLVGDHEVAILVEKNLNNDLVLILFLVYFFIFSYQLFKKKY